MSHTGKVLHHHCPAELISSSSHFYSVFYELGRSIYLVQLLLLCFQIDCPILVTTLLHNPVRNFLCMLLGRVLTFQHILVILGDSHFDANTCNCFCCDAGYLGI